jgi:transposase
MANKDRKFTKKNKDNLVKAIVAGNYITTACEYAGVNHNTFYDWDRKGKRAVEESERDGTLLSKHPLYKYARFNEMMQKAIADSEVGLVAQVRKEAKGDWRAAIAMLERRFPARWGKQDTHNVNLKSNYSVSEPDPPEDAEEDG